MTSAFQSFGELIEILEPSLVGFTSSASGAIEALFGPPREAPLLGGGEIDGYAGLARRGDFERLLLSEWLLADEMPDEFIRRATSNELAFNAIGPGFGRRLRREGARLRLEAFPADNGAHLAIPRLERRHRCTRIPRYTNGTQQSGHGGTFKDLAGTAGRHK